MVIRRGAPVLGPEGPLGEVAHVVVDEPTREISEFVLQRPDGHEWVVPATLVASAEDGAVTLRTGWSDLSSAAQPYAVDEFDTLSGAEALRAAVPASQTTARPVPTRTGGTVQLREEELHVRKQTQELGAVELGTQVVAERQAFDIPVWHEELILEHQRIDPPRPGDEPLGDATSIRVVLREEVPIVDKQPVVTEVVRAGRRTVQETAHIETNARREVADVRTEGDIRLRQPDHLGRDK